MPPWVSETATTSAPMLSSSEAATEPALPKPCTAMVAPMMSSPMWRAASEMVTTQPRPVASTRPSEPPRLTGLPVTTPGTV